MINRRKFCGQVYWTFWCPACQTEHRITKGHGYIEPTGRSLHNVPNTIVSMGAYNCVLTIKDSKIIYSESCDHGLAGQTVSMVSTDEEEE